jgi:hypothetical protein
VIRIGGVGYGYGKQFGQNAIAIAQANRLIEREIPGARVEYHFYDHTGPAINEALAAGQLDFAAYGELPQIIGKANGLPTRVIANGGISTIYVAVRQGVKANSVADLKGLRVTVQRGTILHQALDRLLEEAGLSEKDIQLYDLPTADQLAALSNGEADASVGVASILTKGSCGSSTQPPARPRPTASMPSASLMTFRVNFRPQHKALCGPSSRRLIGRRCLATGKPHSMFGLAPAHRATCSLKISAGHSKRPRFR